MNLGELLGKLGELQKQYGDDIVVSVYDGRHEADFILTKCDFLKAYKPSNQKWAEEFNVAFGERIVLR